MAEYLINIEDQTYEVDVNEHNKIILNGYEVLFELKNYSADSYTLLCNNKIYEVDIISNNDSILQLSIDNDVYEVEVKDRFAQLMERFNREIGEREKEIIIRAPMPGLVLKITVEKGQRVETGSSLLILEAMKMENEIRATSPGVVKDIRIKERTAVEKGDILLILD